MLSEITYYSLINFFIMKKIEILKQAKRFLDAKGCTVQELSDYCAEEQRRLQNLAVADGKTFVMEVMYEGFVRSNVPLKELKPLGVIWKNLLITLQDASEKMSWEKAVEYCRGFKIEGQETKLPGKDFSLDFKQESAEKINAMCAVLGGQPFKEGEMYWTSEKSEHFVNTFGKNSRGGAVASSCYYVRPVLDLENLSL